MEQKKTFNEIINGDKPVLVDFFAEWCSPCKMMKPILEEVKTNLGDKAAIIKIDVDKNPAVAQSLQIRGVPTLVIYKKGQIVWRKSGVVDANQLSNLIQQYI
jgi:thioredoxin 1